MSNWKERLPNVSESTKRRNPHLFMGGLETTKPKPNPAPALESGPIKFTRRKGRVAIIVSLTAHRARMLDDDNNVASFKPLRDAISETLKADDGDSRIRWQYGQVETRGGQGTSVIIETVPRISGVD